MFSRRFRCLALVVSAALLLPTSSRACSVCQCGDPLFTPEGASSQPAGAFSFYLETLVSTKSSGVLPEGDVPPNPGDREKSFDRDLTFYASWTPVAKVTLTASVPFRWVTVTDEPADGGSTAHNNRGFGDAAFYVTTVLWRDLERNPTSWLELRGMVKAPTGQSTKTIAGEEDPHLQVGTGSWDFGLGLAAGHHFSDFAVYASTFYRLNTEGSLHYEYGDVFLANLVAASEALPFVDGIWLRPGAELNFRYAGHDNSGGNVYDSSGGSIGYLTPFLEVPIGRGVDERVPWLRLAARLPLLGDGGLFGHQHEGIIYTAGVGFPF
jgi:hypothetical protein